MEGGDAFVTKLSPSGALVYSTFIGGPADGSEVSSGSDSGYDVAVDSSGSAYVAGRTDSAAFPTTPGAYRISVAPGSSNTFVAKLNPTGTGLVYSTFIGSTTDFHTSIEVDGAGNAYVAGDTFSPSYPTTPGVLRPDPYRLRA